MAQAADIFGNGIESIFEDIGTGVTKAGDMIKNIGDLILKTIVKIQAQKLAANVTDSLLSAFGGGGNNSNSMSTSSWMKYTGLNSGVGSSNNYDFSYHPFAEGGIVSAPTLGLIGERSYKEAIVPLTDGNLKMLGGGNKGGGVQVNIINKTSSKVEVQESRYDDSAQQWVLGVVVDAAERNVNGFGTNMKTALGAR
jgi:phage-related minor tail protein